jgi:hypothetical protein
MLLTTQQLTDDKNLVSHIVLGGIHKHPAVMDAVLKDRVADVRVTVNGAELDLQAFVDHWQSQVERMIDDEAARLVDAKFNEVNRKMHEFNDALRESLNDLRAGTLDGN